MMTIKKLFIDLYLSAYSSEEMAQKISFFIEEKFDVPLEFYELFDRHCDPIQKLLNIIESKSKNDWLKSFEAEYLMADFFLSQLKKYSQKEIEPIELCSLSNKIETAIMDMRIITLDGFIYYPDWLGNMYNVCDWCDESWHYDNSPFLKKEVLLRINEIEIWLKDNASSTQRPL